MILQPADKAWIVLGVGVLSYEVAASDDQLLSEACDRWLLSRPWLTRTVVAVLALHLVNAIPSRLDPLHWLFKAKRQLLR